MSSIEQMNQLFKIFRTHDILQLQLSLIQLHLIDSIIVTQVHLFLNTMQILPVVIVIYQCNLIKLTTI